MSLTVEHLEFECNKLKNTFQLDTLKGSFCMLYLKDCILNITLNRSNLAL